MERSTCTSLVTDRIVAPIVTVDMNNPAPRAPPTETKMSLVEATDAEIISEAPFPKAKRVSPFIVQAMRKKGMGEVKRYC